MSTTALRSCVLSVQILTIHVVSAQPQLENPSFETWNNVGQATEEPVDWSSLKTSDGGFFINSLVPQLCWRSADAHSGNYSVNLRTVSSAAGNANGLLTNGRVHAELNIDNSYMFTDQGDGQWNTLLGSRPDSLVGWFKAVPVSGDRPNVGALLHVNEGRLPAFGTEANWVAGVSWKGPYATVGAWTRFSKALNYLNNTDPEYVLFILTAGDSAGSDVGTQAWYDDFALIYNVHCSPLQSVVQAGADLMVAFSTGGIPTAPTTFSVELSDANGDFSAAVVIGSVLSTAPEGTISCTLPQGLGAGSSYAIRVVTGSLFYAPVGCSVQVELETGVTAASPRDSEIRWTVNGLLITSVDAAASYECIDAQGRIIAVGSLKQGTNLIALDAQGMVIVRVASAAGSFAERVIAH